MNRFLHRWGIWILLAFALLYYGQYYRAGLYPAAEGGVEAMTAMRLLEGKKPIVDTFLGYNLLWFYPVVWLFQVFGPSYTVLRLFFFSLCTVTGLLSFRVVRLSTGSAVAGLLAGFLVLLIPGQMFRNYMAFLVLLNLSVFLPAFLLPARTLSVRLFWMTVCGVTLAVAWLVRVDVGFFLTCLWLGLVASYPLRPEAMGSFLRNAGVALLGALLALTIFTAIHLPFYQDAVRRGFTPQFLAAYADYPAMIRFQAGRLMEVATQGLGPAPKTLSLPPPSQNASEVKAQPQSGEVSVTQPQSPAPQATPIPTAQKQKQAEQATLARRSFMATSARDLMLALNLHLPLPVSVLLALGGMLCWLLALVRHDEELRLRSLVVLAALGCALTLFPQYFFWRPDMVHLSEFMVPMTVALILSCTLLLHSWSRLHRLSKVVVAAFLALAGLTLVLYYVNACQSQSSGGIAAGLNKRFEFQAANGVRVKLTRHELEDATAIYRIITGATAPKDYVICYPYNPEINFMTDRPSYEYNFYVDNVMVPADRFHSETLAKIAKYRPAAFVITDWPINNTEESKFSNWASATYNTIRETYRLAYKDGNLEVYVRPDLAARIPANLAP